MSFGAQIAQILSTLPAIIWACIAACILFVSRGSLSAMIARLSGLEAFGVKLMMSGREAMEEAIEMANKHKRWPVDVPRAEQQQAIDRANAERARLEGTEILWVDDRPANNRNEAQMLRSFGMLVTFAASTAEALDAIEYANAENQPFHIIISDISRDYRSLIPSAAAVPGAAAPPLAGQGTSADPPSHPTAGIDMLAALAQRNITIPVIFYVGTRAPGLPIPAGAFGLTNRPDELLQLIIDVRSRKRG